jgi:hypothetical protein
MFCPQRLVTDTARLPVDDSALDALGVVVVGTLRQSFLAYTGSPSNRSGSYSPGAAGG